MSNVLVDLSGNGNTATIHGCISTKDGLRFDGDYIDCGDCGTNIKSISLRFNNYDVINSSSPAQWLIGSNGDDGIVLGSSTVALTNEIISVWHLSGSRSAYTSSSDSINTGWHSLIINRNSLHYDIYLDGKQIRNTTSGLGGFDLDMSTMKIGTRNSISNYFNGEIQDVRIYNRALSEQEVIQYHNSFITPQLIETFKDVPVGNYPIGWTKVSGDAEVDEYYIQDGELVTNGGFDTDSDWVKSNTTILNGKGIYNSTPSGGGFQQSSILTTDKRYRISFEISDYVEGSVKVRFPYSLNTVNANGSYSFECIANDPINSTAVFFQNVGTTTLKIDNVSVQEIPPLEGFKSGTKLLKQTTAGVNAIPNKTAYGTWEFSINKTLLTNFSIYNIISDNKNTPYNGQIYQFRIGNNNEIIFFKYNGSSGTILSKTANSYIQNNTYYRIKITRTSEGEFTVYIKGGNFGNEYVLVDVTGGSGTNPVIDNTFTESNFFVTDLDAGDEITNIKILDGIEQ